MCIICRDITILYNLWKTYSVLVKGQFYSLVAINELVSIQVLLQMKEQDVNGTENTAFLSK